MARFSKLALGETDEQYRDASLEEAPIVLDEYANTASAGSIIAFSKYHKDLSAGDVGVICSFGAGYSIGSLVIRKRQAWDTVSEDW